MNDQHKLTRRRLLQIMSLGLGGLGGLVMPRYGYSSAEHLLTRAIPSSKQRIPLIGLGSSRTFNVGDDPEGLENVAEVMRHFFRAGGTLIDSSPMYGSSQPAIGYGLVKLGKQKDVFAADKVWTVGFTSGNEQMEQSRRYWQVDTFDLMQIHNLVDWQTHIRTLTEMKQDGKIRYVGITTSHGRRHDELEDILRTQPLDFVQFSYNILDREAEQRLLPIAQQHGIAVIINRPFQRGDLIDALEDKPLPPFAADIGCKNWPQFLLKFIVSHPGVTCAIPATTQVAHVKENMRACYGLLPDQTMRERMIDYVEKII